MPLFCAPVGNDLSRHLRNERSQRGGLETILEYRPERLLLLHVRWRQ